MEEPKYHTHIVMLLFGSEFLGIVESIPPNKTKINPEHPHDPTRPINQLKTTKQTYLLKPCLYFILKTFYCIVINCQPDTSFHSNLHHHPSKTKGFPEYHFHNRPHCVGNPEYHVHNRPHCVGNL